MKKGFTILELMTALVVMMVLTVLTVKTTSSLRMSNRDNKRIADIREIQASLESYYKDAGSYPTSLTVGQPIAFGSSTFMTKVPDNPQPARDGICTATTTYTYQQTDFGASYALSFCLGNRVGDIASGFNTATPGELSSCVPDCYLSCKDGASNDGSDGCGSICNNAITPCPTGYSCVQNHCLAN